MLQKAGSDLEVIEKDIAATTSKIQDCEGFIVLREQESAMASYKRLRLDPSAARAELIAATETDDSEGISSRWPPRRGKKSPPGGAPR